VVALIVWVIIIGIIALIVSKIGIPSPFREVAWAILCIILIVVLVRFAGTVPGGNLG
jgi:hypothetical protein